MFILVLKMASYKDLCHRGMLMAVVLVLLGAAVDAHSHHQTHTRESRDATSVWTYAMLSTALISAAPFAILFFIPLHNAYEHSELLKVLLSFAAGGLLGDAFLHLIPHALAPHHGAHEEHEHHHQSGEGHSHTAELVVGVYVLAGIVAFMVVEKTVHILKGDSGQHHHLPQQPSNQASRDSDSSPPDGLRKRNVVKGKSSNEKDSKKNEDKSINEGTIKASGYLNLAADFAHNFTDGLAIGASYLVNQYVGMVTTMTILLHEIPHEIGDFAILIQSGCSKRKAMMLQLVTAVGALLGTMFGLLAEATGSTTATEWILPFTAGGFIYIALVSVLPELLEESSVWQTVKEVVALLVGIGMMILIGFFE